jgi:hypothetical protein
MHSYQFLFVWTGDNIIIMSSLPSASDPPVSVKEQVIEGVHIANWTGTGFTDFRQATLPVLEGGEEAKSGRGEEESERGGVNPHKIDFSRPIFHSEGETSSRALKRPLEYEEHETAHKALATSSKVAKLDTPLMPNARESAQISALMAAGLTREAAEKAISVARMDDANTTKKPPSYHPFQHAPLAGGTVIDIGRQPEKGKYKFGKWRIDENYTFDTGNITFENKEGQPASFPGWSFKRLKCGEVDSVEYVDHSGKRRKRFTFSGPIATLPELNLAVRMLNRDSNQSPELTLDEARKLEPDGDGIVDLYEACKPVYSTKVCSFSGFRAYWFDNHFTSLSQQPVTYKSFSLAKQKSDRSRARSVNPEKDFFTMQLPARRAYHLELATEMAMELNNMKKLPFPDEVEQQE